MRPIGTISVAVVLVVSVALVGLPSLVAVADDLPPGGTFSDDDGNTHEGMIEAIAAIQVTLGCNPQGTFYCPSDNVRRDQMASFLARAWNLPPSPVDYFEDDNGNTHEGNINKIAHANITLGFPDGTYRPAGFVSREQMASFIARAMGLAPVPGNVFVDVSGTHESNINAIAQAGVTIGCNPAGTLYCPTDNVRRDQMASFIGRALGLDPHPPPPPNTTTTSTTTITSTSTTTTTIPGAPYDILYSSSADRSGAVNINGAAGLGGDIYPFISPSNGVSSVDFYLNDQAMSGQPYHTENFAEFDLGGTAANGTALPFDTVQLLNGNNVVTAHVFETGGGQTVVHANVNVSNPNSLVFTPPSLVVRVPSSSSEDVDVTVKTNNPGAAVPFNLSESLPWLSLSATSGTTNQVITLTFDTSGLSPGIQTGVMTVTNSGYAGAMLPVTMIVQAIGDCAPLECPIQVNLPFTLEFTTDVVDTLLDADQEGAGLTWVQRPDSSEGYIPGNLDLNLVAGTLSILTTDGLNLGNPDTQDNTIGVPFDDTINPTLGTVEIRTTLLQPPSGTGNFEQAGLWFGNGRDNYVKLELISTPGPANKIELLVEEGASPTNSTKSEALGDLSGSTVELILVANPTTNMVTGSYQINGGVPVVIDTFSVPAEFFSNGGAVINPNIGTDTFAGIYASHRNGPAPLVYVFDRFAVSVVP